MVFFYVHRVLLSYTRDRRLKFSSKRLGNEDKASCPRPLLPGQGSNRGPPAWKSEALTARPRQLLKHTQHILHILLGTQLPIFTPEWREQCEIKCLAEGQKCQAWTGIEPATLRSRIMGQSNVPRHLHIVPPCCRC